MQPHLKGPTMWVKIEADITCYLINTIIDTGTNHLPCDKYYDKVVTDYLSCDKYYDKVVTDHLPWDIYYDKVVTDYLSCDKYYDDEGCHQILKGQIFKCWQTDRQFERWKSPIQKLELLMQIWTQRGHEKLVPIRLCQWCVQGCLLHKLLDRTCR